MMGMLSGISVSSDGRHFIDQTGSPFFLLGDTLWELFRMFTEDEALSILEARKAQGFNTILVMLTGVDTSNFADAKTEPFVDPNGEVPWTDNDPLTPNERYFQRIDAIIRLGARTGQILVVGIYHQWQVDTIPEEKARRWGRWIGERYREVPNLIWSMYPRATAEYIPVCRELALGLGEGDGSSHLISVHPDPAIASSSFIHEEPWLAFNMIQTCVEYERIPEAVSHDYSLSPTKPVIMAEGGYEGLEFGKLQTPHDIRKQAYWTALSGGYFVYGHNESWLDPRAYRRWISARGADDMKLFGEIVRSLPYWWKLVPDNGLILAGGGSGMSQSVAARAADRSWIAVYMSEPSCVTLDLSLFSRDSARLIWCNPATGEKNRQGVKVINRCAVIQVPHGWNDAFVAVFENPIAGE